MSGSSYAYGRAWYLQNQEKVRAYRRKRYAANKKKFRADQKAWYATHKDKARAYSATRKAQQRLIHRAWKTRNPDKVRRNRLMYERRARTAPGVASVEQIAARMAFFGNACSYCGGSFEHVEHAIPLSRGGTNWPANLRPACSACNLVKGVKTIFEFLKVPRSTSPFTK